MTGHLAKKGSRWYVVLNLTDPLTGNRRKKWISTGKTRKRDAEVELHRILTEANQGTFVEPSSLTVRELLIRWLEDDAKLRVETSSYSRYHSIIYRHLIPHLGEFKLKGISAADIQRYYRMALEGGKVGQDGESLGEPLAEATVKKHHNVLNRAFKQAVKWGMIPRNVVEATTPPKIQRSMVTVWSNDEMVRFIREAAKTENYIVYALALGTGLRRGELFGLKWEDVDLQRRVIAIRRSLLKPSNPPTFKSPKTNTSWRVIDISEGLVRLLKQHKAKQDQHKSLLCGEYEDYDLVLAQPNGRCMHPNNLTRREYRRLIKRADVPYIKFHALRHTHATDLLRKGIHPKIVSERLGHESIRITMDIYSHVLPSMQSEAAAVIDDILPDTEQED